MAIYNKSLNSSGNFDYTLCSRKSREKYAETHERKLPLLGVQDEVEKTELEELEFYSLLKKLSVNHIIEEKKEEEKPKKAKAEKSTAKKTTSKEKK